MTMDWPYEYVYPYNDKKGLLDFVKSLCVYTLDSEIDEQ